MFKRRDKRGWLQSGRDLLYPPGGWRRALRFIAHRLRRLPDPPSVIARGCACGVFVCFTPLFGFHFILAAVLALCIRGNVIASLLSTAFGNPITFPIIAVSNMRLGNWVLGNAEQTASAGVLQSFSRMFGELKDNLGLFLTGGEPHWTRLDTFFHAVFLPYGLGGVTLGLIAGVITFYLTKPLIAAYQRRRRRVFAERLAARVRAQAAEKPNTSP